VSASWACLARVLGWNLNYWNSNLGGFVGERVTEETVWYPIHLPSALAAQFSFPSPELVEAFDGDACAVLDSEVRQVFDEQPSVCADIVALSSTQPSKLESCFTSMSVLVSVRLQCGSTVLVSDLSQRDVSSNVELPQNPAALLVHHSDSNAVAVLVDRENVLACAWSWRLLLKQHKKAVATGHQDACGSPTIIHVLQQPPVGSISLDRQAKAFAVAAHTKDWVSTPCTFPREEALVEAYCWMLDLVGDLASLPSVPLRFLDQLARYPSALVVSIDSMVQFRVRPRFRGQYRLERRGRDLLEDFVGFTELSPLKIGQVCKVELQYLLRRYLPDREMLSQLLELESSAKVFGDSSPCLKAGVSLR
jgi:hypothetical protein